MRVARIVVKLVQYKPADLATVEKTLAELGVEATLSRSVAGEPLVFADTDLAPAAFAAKLNRALGGGRIRAEPVAIVPLKR